MAMPTVHPALAWTAERVRALPEDGKRYEVLDGELLVSPSPSGRHQVAVGRLYRILAEFVETHGLGLAMCSPSEIEYSPTRLVQPDIYVIPVEGGKVRLDWHRAPSLLLVAEVLSRSTARQDRVTKRRMYLEQGVPQYWVVDLWTNVIERWSPSDDRPEVCDTSITWHPASHAPALTIDVAKYLADVHAPWSEGQGW